MGEYLTDSPSDDATGLRMLSPVRIAPNPFQPRREFAPEQLAELEDSIRRNGLLQPVVVRAARTPREGVDWELVAGERRWRAVRRLGWTEVPAVVKDLDDETMLVLALVENLQRDALTALEEAQGYRQLMDSFGLTQAAVAERMGLPRSTVANLLRLLHLPASVQRLLNEGQLSMGHARALLGLEEERQIAELAREAVAAGLSVRMVEERVRARRTAPPAEDAPRPIPRQPGEQLDDDPHLRRLETELRRALGTAARIRLRAGKAGRIEIPFHNADDFDRVLELILGADARPE